MLLSWLPGSASLVARSRSTARATTCGALAGSRLRVLYESALGEVELWNKSAASQLDAQLRDRRRNFTRRLEAMERIQQAAVGLDERIAELETQEAMVDVLAEKLGEFAGHLVEPSQAAGGPAPSSPSPEGGPAAALAGWQQTA